MRIYIAGKITGDNDYVDKFKRTELFFKHNGYKVYNPVPIGVKLKDKLGREPSHEEYMNNCLPYLLKSDAVYFLRGWEESEGAKLEYKVAVATDKIIMNIG